VKRALRGWWLVVLVASLGSAQELYVPAAAHTSGAAGTVWRTDLEVKARGGEPASFTVELLEERTANPDPLAATFSLERGASLRLVDVVDAEFGFNGSGALRVTAVEGAVLATSRTYNTNPNGTYGQYIAGFDAEAAAEHGHDYALVQLSSTAAYRTNVGFVNTTGASLALEVELFTAAAVQLGSVPLTLRPYEMRQVPAVFSLVTGEQIEDGYAMVRTSTEGGRFFAYASVVDNLSGDAIFIPAQLDGPLDAPPEPRFVVFEAFMRPG
jgi:hypothetical protein